MNCVTLLLRRRCLLAAWILLSVAFARAAEPETSGPVIELPKFVVTDSRELPQPESWRHGTMAGFEVLSNASDRATQRLLRDFDMFRQALSLIWPVSPPRGTLTPLIIAGRGNKFDAFVPKGKSAAEMARASVLLRQGDKAAIVIDVQATSLNILDSDTGDAAASGVDAGRISVDHDKQLYREYVRFLLSASEPRLPAWFEEGLSQIIMKMEFHKRWLEFGKLEDANTISAEAAAVAAINATAGEEGEPSLGALPGAPAEDRDFPAALRRRPLVPLQTMFSVPHDAPEAINPLGNNRWAKQSYAFVHMCLYGYNGKYQKAFMTFLQRAAREPVTEQLFKECFNMTYAKMLMEIRSYSEFTVYKTQGLQSEKGGPDMLVTPPPLALRDATQAEVGRIKGEALVLAGHQAAAKSELIAPYLRGERDPNLLAALGLFEKRAGEEDRARKFLEAAFAGKSPRSDAAIELARYRLAEAVAQSGEGAKLSAVQVAAVLQPLHAVRKNPPPRFGLYDLAAETWMRAADNPQRDDLALLFEGAQLFPTRLKLVYQTATVAGAAGDLALAHVLADHGVKYAPAGVPRQRFTDLKAALPPEPPKAEPAPNAAEAPAKKR